MEFEKAFYGENAANDFIKMLKMEYCYYKVVIVKSEDIKTNSAFENICNVCAKHCVINLPNNIEFNLLCEELVKKELTDDVSLVVVFANHNWAVAINKFFNNVAMVCLAPSINQLMVKTSMMVYDYGLVAKCSKNEFISCYGEICSILSYIMEVVFFKGVYNLNINSQQLLKLEKYLFDLARLPQKFLSSAFGKMYIIKLCYKIVLELNCDLFNNSCVVNLSNNLKSCNINHFTKNRISIYSTLIMLKAFIFLFNSQLDVLIGFSAQSRLLIAKQNNKKLKESVTSQNLNNYGYDRLMLKNNFNLIKDDYKNVLNVYIKTFNKLYDKFKSLQFDKGFLDLKTLKTDVVQCAFNKLPEQGLMANFATFIREFGFYNMF